MENVTTRNEGSGGLSLAAEMVGDDSALPVLLASGRGAYIC
jgi:hypothetical protein